MTIETINALQAFSKIAALDENAFFLDRAALTIALDEYPNLNIQEYLRKLDTLAARVEMLAGEDRSAVNLIESLNEALFVQEGLRGNSEDFDDPRNCYLNEVLDRRLGIPLSLSIIYMEVARRIDFPIKGIGFPEHFLVKHASQGQQIIIDPYDQGRILTLNECQELLDATQSGNIKDSLLQSMGKRSIITRMLYNLKSIYLQKDQYFKALTVIERILMLNPGTPSEVRDRGLIYMQISLFANAVADLEFYLAHSVAPDDSAYIQDHVKLLRRIVCASN